MKRIAKIVSFSSMAAAILAIAAATVLEKINGTEAALGLVYHSPWFIALWAVTAVSGLILLLKSGMSRRICTIGLHMAFVLILAGALTTHLFGESGMIHLQKYQENNCFEKEDGEESPLGFALRLERFSIDYYPDGKNPKDYRSEVTILPEGQKRTISMNHILKWEGFRFYQADYDSDRRGSILAVSHDPWGTGITYAGYILLLVSMIGFFFQKESRFKACCSQIQLTRRAKTILYITGGVLLLGCFALICRKWIFEPLMPVLRSPLLWIHVLSMIFSYTAFALVAILGIAGLVSRKEDTKERLRNISLVILYPAVFLLTFGTFIGAVWANISWGNYWSWDPKETWALITLLIYAFALHSGILKWFDRPRFFHAYSIFAFICVLFTYFGVNLLLGGMHAYS